MNNFVYFGSSTFSKIVIEEIIAAGFLPSLIITKPDAPKGRGLKIFSTKVSNLAQQHKIKVVKPANLNEKSFLQKIKQIQPNYIVVADYGKIIPAAVLKIPQNMPLGIHPSLLPFYRGAAPIERTLMAGESLTGVTIFKINFQVDAGPVIMQKKIEIKNNDDYFSLRHKLASLGAKAFLVSLDKIKNNQFKLQPQNDSRASLACRLTKEDGKINWNKPAREIKNIIRATLGWPTAYTYYKHKQIKITEAEALPEKSEKNPAAIIQVDKSGIYVSTGSGILKINKLKPEGKKEMPSWAFACGHRIEKGDCFDLRRTC